MEFFNNQLLSSGQVDGQPVAGQHCGQAADYDNADGIGGIAAQGVHDENSQKTGRYEQVGLTGRLAFAAPRPAERVHIQQTVAADDIGENLQPGRCGSAQIDTDRIKDQEK